MTARQSAHSNGRGLKYRQRNPPGIRRSVGIAAPKDTMVPAEFSCCRASAPSATARLVGVAFMMRFAPKTVVCPSAGCS
jgi:hypothetical protein